MKVTANIGDLLEATNQAGVTVDKMTQMCIGDVYLKASKKDGRGTVYLYSTNIANECFVKIPANVEEEGEVMFDPALMEAGLIGRPREDEVSLSTQGTQVRVQYKRNKFHLSTDKRTSDMATRVKAIPFRQTPWFSMAASDLMECHRRTMFCIPTGGKTQQEKVLGGLYLLSGTDCWEAYATDGSIAAALVGKHEGTKPGGKAIIPAGSLPVINRLIGKRGSETVDVIQAPNEGPIYFKTGDLIVSSRVLPGHLDNVKAMVNSMTAKNKIIVNREEFKFCLDRASAFAEQRFPSLLMDIKEDGIAISTKGVVAENDDVVDIDAEGKTIIPTKICVNRGYLISAFASCRDQKVTLGFGSGLEPLLIEEGSPDKIKTKYVIMPVRI